MGFIAITLPPRFRAAKAEAEAASTLVGCAQLLRIRPVGEHAERLFIFGLVDLEAYTFTQIKETKPTNMLVGQQRVEACGFEKGMRESCFANIREGFHGPHAE
jgi:hypothetical protein